MVKRNLEFGGYFRGRSQYGNLDSWFLNYRLDVMKNFGCRCLVLSRWLAIGRTEYFKLYTCYCYRLSTWIKYWCIISKIQNNENNYSIILAAPRPPKIIETILFRVENDCLLKCTNVYNIYSMYEHTCINYEHNLSRYIKWYHITYNRYSIDEINIYNHP